MSQTILIAPSGFKEAMDPDQVAACIARGLHQADRSFKILSVPLVDGGEGTARLLARLTRGRLVAQWVTGPIGEPVEAHIALLGGDWVGTAVVEVAQAAGLRLVPHARRNPMHTTTRGVGELIRAALDLGVERVIVGCGDSGTNDAGAGAVQALGVRLLDAQGCDLPPGGAALSHLAKIVLDDRDPRLSRLSLEVACNWSVKFSDVTRKFAVQKGADTQQMQELEAAFAHFAHVVERDLGINIHSLPGGGASGGLGAGLAALLGATLCPRFEVMFRFVDFDRMLAQADLVITAEGRLDGQTCPGKVPAEVGRRASRLGIPVIVLAGSIGDDAHLCLQSGVTAYESILSRPSSLENAIAQTPQLLVAAAERLGRMIRVNVLLGQGDTRRFAYQQS